ncbi:alpha/beta fold hydrolase [Paenibacillus sp. IHBB 10380]|uniref:alpha/beta fold hydrolase n=1 Tax=Paenibacillus sp. IHBB 10380 TaxID=1566358 RepID=UPI0005CFAD60|nr:alpha/beta hydrolase [Paenibacillus sp. IHBB 10380]AJS58577.1 Ndr family protein [Paenibacillus sp. IHBB 10380]
MSTKDIYKSESGKNDVLKYYDEMLKKYSHNNKHYYVDTRYGKTFVIEAGAKTGPPIILLHGSGMSSIMWLKDIEEYSKEYRVFAIDILGEPGKSEANRLLLEGDFHSEWLLDIFESLDIRRANIIGISLGGWIALKFAIDYPEMVEKLVLISPSGIGGQKKSFVFKYLLHMILGEKGKDKLYYKINGNKPMPDTILRYQRLIVKNFNYRSETIPIFNDQELKKLQMPISIFIGKKDIMLKSLETKERAEKLFVDVNINYIKDAGHSINNISKDIIKFINLKEIKL